MAAAKSMAAPVSQRCSRVRVAISPPYWEKNPELMGEAPRGAIGVAGGKIQIAGGTFAAMEGADVGDDLGLAGGA